jgi:exonuclease VII small subunit
MATEITNHSVPEEQVSLAEDVQAVSVTEAPQEAESESIAESVGSVQESTSEEPSSEQERIDFADEEAALAARSAGLDDEDETTDDTDTVEDNGSSDDLFAGKSEAEIVSLFAKLLEEEPVQSLRRVVEAVKITFYKVHRSEVEAQRRAFVEAGGDEASFTPAVDAQELRLKELFKEYRRRRDEFIASLDAEKEVNLKIKLQIIEELKVLIDSDETLNHTFTKFRELQQRWRDTGPVPQQHVKDLWETYNLHVENFYNFIKINKELRDLDLKKNYEQKVALCEAAEALILEPSIVEAFHKLQKLHDQWRETGPVANEYKEALWERFKEASSRINKQHQAYFEDIKAEQTKNLSLKSELCEQTEELSQQPYTSRKEWNKASDRLLEIQKVWKTIGFAPKKENTRIYERFRAACDKFFEAKRRFYADIKVEMEHNLQLKTELCEAAEALQNSEEWKKTTDELIALQARWKEIGAVSRRYSDQVWKRFRAACDAFFARKSAYFANVDGEHEQNLTKKLALLDEMAAADVKTGGFDLIKEFQRRWSEIGFVPLKRKEEIQRRYKECVDKLFSTLRGSERERTMSRFREKVSSFKGATDRRFRSERERLYNKVKQLESDIALLENNIGFFARSKGAEALIADVREKIERAKREMADTIEKVKLIDQEAAKQEQNESRGE